MTVTTYQIEHDEHGFYVTDGLWCSAYYPNKTLARKVMHDAQWGERGRDNSGTHADKRVS